MKIENPKFNASRELVAFDGLTLNSKGQAADDEKTLSLIKELKNLPRIDDYTGKTAPRVKVGDKEYRLSYKFYTDKEKETYQNYRKEHTGTGGGGSSNKVTNAELLAQAKVIVGLKGVPEATKKYFQAIIDEATEGQKKKLETALKAMMAAGIPEAQAKAALGL